MNLTLSRTELDDVIKKVTYYAHGGIHQGKLVIRQDAFLSVSETNISISNGARIDLTGSVEIGPWCMIGDSVQILTHDHLHKGRDITMIEMQRRNGIVWKDKRIGKDVWIHSWSIILMQVTEVGDGAVIGAGSVLTKNPGPHEIWAGNPAIKVGER